MDKKKVVALEDRLPQLKKERKQKANRRFALYATVFFLLVLIVVYIQSPLSRVQSITVQGEQITSSARVIKASGISNKTHIWDIGEKAVTRKIKKLPAVRSVTIKKKFPNHVTLSIREYTRKAYLQKNDGYYPILQNGAMLNKLSKGTFPFDAPVLIGFSEQDAIKKVAEGLSGISKQMAHNISDIHYIKASENNEDLVLYMNDGNQVVASTRTFVKNIKLYPEIVANLPKDQRGTIHLSVGSYFVPEDVGQSSQESSNKP
ncbi:cell division protein FtsQ/DivIB [Sporolactobacillus terrae]|uniref:Cell division protein DivIB n=1 Tax=Sporolactobacillus terrae TaxID=269673 RepID=A0A410D851_9BACL|nr:FtsQ-type POTRA domain-containing protein [Sporolactobacillus terrae]QAA22265.1 cell division protein FtsQ [Sporolactobacillus terrae]QAA25239.1 cell division protein FtsQ [Sporolactobacillus terrae]UAK17054.1 FtsQ-type POTRA domain-containing protein [Sporolactobacillus terrae]BBN98576.1 cell division protein DivIB [Sporolactobacillus terrae]